MKDLLVLIICTLLAFTAQGLVCAVRIGLGPRHPQPSFLEHFDA